MLVVIYAIILFSVQTPTASIYNSETLSQVSLETDLSAHSLTAQIENERGENKMIAVCMAPAAWFVKLHIAA
jgi:hypothetical protein